MVALGPVAAVAAPLLVVVPLLGLLLLGGESAATCNPAPGTASSVTIDTTTVPAGPIGSYGGVQLVNAAYILKAGTDLGLGVRDQTIGVMTAMGESSLNVIDYGDQAGPDSRGLFQQRDNGAWGTYADRMDPYISATNFFTAMMKVPNRDGMQPTQVAHQTQRNANPDHYTKYWTQAVAVVEGLTGVDTGLATGAVNPVCSSETLTFGEVNAAGWTTPSNAPASSRYGPRAAPVKGASTMHLGLDLDGACGDPIWAANAGTVTVAGMDRNGTGTITIDHGSNIKTSYLHMESTGIYVRAGDKVTAGQPIGAQGNTGFSSGCHLHFEVIVNGLHVDPVPFMQLVGIKLA